MAQVWWVSSGLGRLGGGDGVLSRGDDFDDAAGVGAGKFAGVGEGWGAGNLKGGGAGSPGGDGSWDAGYRSENAEGGGGGGGYSGVGRV